MMGIPIRVLVVEDSEPDAHLLLHELERSEYDPEYEIVDTPETMAAALEQSWDVIIADYVLPHFSGLDALRMVQEKGLDTPFIMVSGKIGEDVAIDTMRAGAQDYVLKTNLGRLGPATKREIRDARRRQRTNEARSQAEDALRRAYAEQELRVAERTEELLKANVLLGKEISDRKRLEDALQESAQEFRALAESIPQIVWATQPDGWNTYFNQQWVDYTGMTLEESYGHGWNIPFHPDDQKRAWDAWQNAVKNDEAYSLECRLRRADGAYRWWLIRGAPLRDASGRIVKWFGTCTDIQDIKEAEEELAAARAEAERRAAELQSFIVSMADGVTVWDAAGNVVFLNEAGRQILGVPADVSLEAASAAYHLRTLEGEPIPEEQWGSRRALRGEEVKDFRARMVTPWKETVVSYSAAPVLDAAGRVIGATSVLRDVSERVELERQREDLYDREHRIAQMLQSALVPPMARIDIEGCRAALKYEPALSEAQVGGDFYDVFQLSEGRVGIVIGDIAGKGLAAAVYVAAAKHAIRSYAYLFASPAEVMQHANDALCRTELGDQMETSMLTAFFAVVDPHTGTMTYANAGHDTPLIRHADGSIEDIPGMGIALGVLCGCEYTDFSRRLGPDDTVVMVTDGITEARLSGPLLFGKDGVLRYLTENPDVALSDIPAGLLEAARAFGGGRLQDDAAIVAFQCKVERPTSAP